MRRDFYDDMHDDMDDIDPDTVSTSQASPIRHPEPSTKTANRNIFQHKHRRSHYLPNWMMKIREVGWWQLRNGEGALAKAQRTLDYFLERPPMQMMADYRRLEMNHLHDRELWMDFSRTYSNALKVYPHSCLYEGYLGPWHHISFLFNLEEDRKRELKKYQDAVKDALPKYEESWPEKVASLRRAVTSAQRQAEVLQEKRERRKASLRKHHGKKPRYLDNQRVLYEVDEYADPEEDTKVEKENECLRES